MALDERAAMSDVDRLLTPYQRVRFRIFEENMEQQKIELLLKVRGGASSGGTAPSGV
jgi:hypothetical protein